jgi:hypothetical protein
MRVINPSGEYSRLTSAELSAVEEQHYAKAELVARASDPRILQLCGGGGGGGGSASPMDNMSRLMDFLPPQSSTPSSSTSGRKKGKKGKGKNRR